MWRYFTSYAPSLKCTLIKVNSAGEEAEELEREGWEKPVSVAVGGDGREIKKKRWMEGGGGGSGGGIKVVRWWFSLRVLGDVMLEGAAHTDKSSTSHIYLRIDLESEVDS